MPLRSKKNRSDEALGDYEAALQVAQELVKQSQRSEMNFQRP